MRIAALALLFLLVVAPAAVADDPPKAKAPVFKPAFPATEAEVMHATDHWILWMKREVIPTGQRAQPSHWQWWVQSVTTGKTRKFLEYRGRWWMKPVSVLRDGTVLLTHVSTIHWYHPDDPVAGDPMRDERPGRKLHPQPQALGFKTTARKFHFLRGTEEGCVAQPFQTMTHQAAWWIPFKGRTLDWKQRKRMTSVKGTYVNHKHTYHPAGHEIAWHGFIFDTKTGRGRGLPGGVLGHVRAFDGRWAADFRAIARMKDATRRKLPRNTQVFAFRGNRAYAIKPSSGHEPTKLVAIDCADGRLVSLHGMDTPHMSSSLHRQDRANVVHIHKMGGGPYMLFWNRLGIHQWVNDHWRFQPWLPEKPVKN